MGITEWQICLKHTRTMLFITYRYHEKPNLLTAKVWQMGWKTVLCLIYKLQNIKIRHPQARPASQWAFIWRWALSQHRRPPVITRPLLEAPRKLSLALAEQFTRWGDLPRRKSKLVVLFLGKDAERSFWRWCARGKARLSGTRCFQTSWLILQFWGVGWDGVHRVQ